MNTLGLCHVCKTAPAEIVYGLGTLRCKPCSEKFDTEIRERKAQERRDFLRGIELQYVKGSSFGALIPVDTEGTLLLVEGEYSIEWDDDIPMPQIDMKDGTLWCEEMKVRMQIDATTAEVIEFLISEEGPHDDWFADRMAAAHDRWESYHEDR